MQDPLANGGLLSVQSLRKVSRGREVVKNASLRVCPRELVGLLGPKGSGKRAILQIIAGITAASGGRIIVDGRDVSEDFARRRRRLGIAYVPGRPSSQRLSNLFTAWPLTGPMTVAKQILSALRRSQPDHDRRAAELESLLDEFCLSRRRNTPLRALSGGERLRCEMAHALASRPKFVLLDEPFSSIDPLAADDIRRHLLRRLAKRGIGVLITDPDVRETLGVLDRAYIIFDGQVVTSGEPWKIVSAGPD